MSRNARNKSKRRFVSAGQSEEETEEVTAHKRSLNVKRDQSSKKVKESGGKRAKIWSQSRLRGVRGKAKRSKRDVKYSVSSDSEEKEVNGNKSTGDRFGFGSRSIDSRLKDSYCTPNTRNMTDSNAVKLQSGAFKPEDTVVVNAALAMENASEAPLVTVDSIISVNEFQRQIAELFAESDRLIAESEASFVDLISPSSTRTEVINLVETSTDHIIDLTEDSPVQSQEPDDIVKYTQQDRNVPECPVCYEKLSKRETSVTPCGHYFCTDCIKKSLHRSKRCPTCRKRCFPKQLYPLFMWKE